MLKSFRPDLSSHLRDPRDLMRGLIGVLLAANLVAVWFVYRTPGGTLEDLESQLVASRKQLVTHQQSVARLKQLVAHTDAAREAGDEFLNTYFLPRRHAYSLLELDLLKASKAAGIRARERTNSYEPIEGSDTLGMLNINANFEGSYADLIHLVNELDRSRRLVIIEQLQATPQQGSNSLAILVKLNTFFRAEGPQEAAEEVPAEALAPVRNDLLRPARPATVAPAPVRAPMPHAGAAPPPPSQMSEPRSGPAVPMRAGPRPGQMPGSVQMPAPGMVPGSGRIRRPGLQPGSNPENEQ